MEYKVLRTSQKRIFVNALESFHPYIFQENLALSLSKQERNKKLLNYLSYNRLSKSNAHKQVVKDLRDKKLKSWYSEVERLLENEKNEEKDNFSEAISFIAQRPGLLLRMFMRLYRLGYSLDIIFRYLTSEHYQAMSAQTLISNLQYFGQSPETVFTHKLSDEDFNIEEKEKEFQAAYHFFYECLKRKMSQIDIMKEQKVFLEKGMYDLDHSIIETNAKSDDDTYMRSGIAFKIPEETENLRFFIYWNDEHNIDIDLHADAYDEHGDKTHIGYYTSYKNRGMVFSGDIRHSDAAEYIDINIKEALSHGIVYVENNIDIYSGAHNFKDIDTVYTGMMAVHSLNEDVKLYNEKNVFFRHNLNSSMSNIDYAYINLEDRYLRLKGKRNIKETSFTISQYLTLLFESQNVELVDDKEDADIILSLDKNTEEKGVSLLDEDFFLPE